jgi:CubicO group peptidase (beta-lactamase class C family)
MIGVQFPASPASSRITAALRSSRLGARRPAQHFAAFVDGEPDVPPHVRHFGGTGTFLWVDPEVHAVCAALTTRAFGEGRRTRGHFSDAVLDELALSRRDAAPQ